MERSHFFLILVIQKDGFRSVVVCGFLFFGLFFFCLGGVFLFGWFCLVGVWVFLAITVPVIFSLHSDMPSMCSDPWNCWDFRVFTFFFFLWTHTVLSSLCILILSVPKYYVNVLKCVYLPFFKIYGALAWGKNAYIFCITHFKGVNLCSKLS